jgi:integrase
LNAAQREKMIKENPVKEARCPKKENKEMSFLDPEEVKLFLKSTEGAWPYHALFWLAVNTGLRRGELLGLEWGDINFDDQTLTVNRQLIRKQGYEFEITSPKTKSARRTISLNETTVSKLKKHRKSQLKIRMKATKWEESSLVFTNKKGGFVRPSALRSYFIRRLKEVELDQIRFHDLRHTCASLLLSRGVDPSVISNMLGHSRVSTTLDVYGHLIPAKSKRPEKQWKTY